ncbi:MAG: peptidylprolyl isomerase [Armatimonadetes bacterium]|nr:peptidylprolyl isomerase [Armatimonadota bacterium]
MLALPALLVALNLLMLPPATWRAVRAPSRKSSGTRRLPINARWRGVPGTYVVLDTTVGEIVLRMFTEDAPRTVANFVGLAEGTREFVDHRTGERVKRPFYDGLTFHRAVRDFLIQGGCPRGDGTGGPGYFLADERPIKYDYHRGMVCMARIQGKPNTAGSQFFILVADVVGQLPREYVVFGHVVRGMEVVDRIASAPTEPNPYDPTERSKPVTPVHIRRARVARVPVARR